MRNPEDGEVPIAENSGKGTGNDLKGRLKDAGGGLSGDKSMRAEGKWDQAKGKVQVALGDAQRRIDRESDDDDTARTP